MRWDSSGNRHYSSSLEALNFLRDTTRSVVVWLHRCRETREITSFPHYRSLLNDIANITGRWIQEQEREKSVLQERVHALELRISELEGPAAGPVRPEGGT